MNAVVVEDHELFRELITKILSVECGLAIVGEADNLSSALTQIETGKPDLVLLDLIFHGGNGFELMRRRRDAGGRERYIILSSHCDEYTALQFRDSQAVAFVDKATNTVSELKRAIEAVRDGMQYFSSSFCQTMLKLLSGGSSSLRCLSQRELQVLQMIAGGCDDGEIAAALGISPRTAQVHRTQLLKKSGLHSSAKLCRYAHEKGFMHYVHICSEALRNAM